MDQHVWDEIDRVAEREAEALRQQRKYRSFSQHRLASGVVTRHQAIWDEQLTVQYTVCGFCGTTLEPSDNKESTPTRKRGHRRSLYTQDIDVCESCLYLHGRLMRSVPVSHAR